MSPSLTSAPLSSIDRPRMTAQSDPSKQNTINISTTPIDDTHLSPYPIYQTYSNSASPSNFDTPAELTSENSGFSDYDYAADDEFFGVDFDAAGEQPIDADPLILEGVPLPTTELPAVEAYLPSPQANRAQSSETTTSSTYPMTSNQSSPPSRHSPKTEAHEANATMTSFQYEQTREIPASQGMMPYDIQTTLESAKRTHDQSASGYSGGDNIGLGVANHMGHSPRLTLTSWESREQQEIQTEPDPQDEQYSTHQTLWQDGIQDHTSSNHHVTVGYNFQTSRISSSHLGISQDELETEDLDEVSGRSGLNPEIRKSLSNVEIPNLKDQDKAAQIRAKNMEIDEWRSQAGDSSDPADEDPNQSRSTLSAPATSTRRRARTTGAIPDFAVNQYGFEAGAGTTGAIPDFVANQHDLEAVELAEGEDIDPVSDSESVRENQLKEDQVYYNPYAIQMSAGDKILMQQPRHWSSDGPIYPYITRTEIQAPTANEAQKRWMDAAETFSVLSRTATWGTRRRSEPSIADIESLNSGSILKRLSFKNDKEKSSSPGFIDRLGSMVRRTSGSSNKLKRARSPNKDARGRSEVKSVVKQEGNLAPPKGTMHRRGASSPRLVTNVGGSPISGSSHGGSGPVSATASSPPRNPLGGFMGSVIRRARSGSNLGHDPSKDGIVGMWSKSGGPPVPVLASTPFESETKPLDFSDAEGEDDDDDEPGDDGEVMDFDQTTPSAPNFTGFQEHVIRLYPHIERSYLVDRIAHQQVVRYKALLQWRVKHSGCIENNNCPAGDHCIALGGSPTLLEPKNQHRDSDASNTGAQALLDASDGDSNPEGALAADSFPPGVPMPPAQTLPAEFECQLCFRVKKFMKPSDWTKHVHEDVQPFTCTYPSCKEPKSFKRKADWVRHENERHRRLSWWTCTVDDCQHKCYRKDNFLQHLVREHKIPEPKQKTKAAAKKVRNSDEAIWVMIRNCHHETTAKPQDEPCKFCGKVLNSWKKLTVHLAKHMELISLSVLRLVEQQAVNPDTIISPVEPLPVRPAPLTPVERNDRRPSTGSMQYSNMSASISPHVGSMSHFSSPLYPQASPNIQDIPQFSQVMYSQNIAYNTTNTGQDMSSYNVQAQMPQQQHQHNQQPGLMFDNAGMSYSHQMGAQMDNTQPRGYPTMDHSPSLDQTAGFAPVNRTYTPINQQQGYPSYPSSNQTLSPDPNFVSAPPQVPGFPSHAIAPNQQTYATSPNHAPSYPPQQMLGVDENLFKYQAALQGTDNGFGYDQMSSTMRSPGGYPSTSNGGYPAYHNQ